MSSRSRLGHPVWGPLLKDYLTEPSIGESFAVKATSHQIAEALDVLKSGSPPLTAFEVLLSLPNQPRQLRRLLDTDLVPTCIKLLEQYCKANALFDYAYGLLCFRTLALTLEISVAECLDPVILDTLHELGPKSSHKALAKLIALCIMEAVLCVDDTWESCYGIQSLNWYRRNGERPGWACLPASGGVSLQDVISLMENLLKKEGTIQHVFRVSGILGFGTVLFVFWQHTLMPGSQESLHVTILSLIIRYWPYAVPEEYELLRHIFRRICEKPGTYIGNRLISSDPLDLLSIVETYTSVIGNPTTSPVYIEINDIVGIVDVIRKGPITSIAGAIGALLTAALDQCWLELTLPRLGNDEF
ncbi:hypothetical protein FRC07_013570 [Ceratobasidium sp. 392]|nr:hypothetical protein FRC07_013570 [Ceratobasidium sp. 392]